jgi:hypothetical protein
MLDVAQELMTPDEAARWFRRSPSWLRHQPDVLKLGGPAGQPLYHVNACRAYVLGRICGLRGPSLRQMQIKALAAACGVDPENPGAAEGRPFVPVIRLPAAKPPPAQEAVGRPTASASFSSIAPS